MPCVETFALISSITAWILSNHYLNLKVTISNRILKTDNFQPEIPNCFVEPQSSETLVKFKSQTIF